MTNIRTRVPRRAGAGLALAASLALGGVGSAAATTSNVADEGLWYMDIPGVQEAHADGITGRGVTIAVLDDPIYLDLPTLRGANIEVQDSFCFDASGVRLPGTSDDPALAFHGTNVVSLIVGTGEGYPGQRGVTGVAPDAKILFYGDGVQDCFDENGAEQRNPDAWASAIEHAIAQGADIISISLIGADTDPLRAAVATAHRAGVIIVAGLSNGAQNDENGQFDLSRSVDAPPATMNGVVSVMAAGSDGTLILNMYGKPNTSWDVKVVGPGVDMLTQGHPQGNWEYQSLRSGTSYATPIVASNLALAMQKYPAATPNQILQSMIHNTGIEGEHEPAWKDNFGYGFVVTQTLLAADPTQYEDVNPFIVGGISGNPPSYREIFGEDGVLPGTTPESTDTDTTNSLLPLLIIIAGIILLLVIATIIIAIVRISRKPKESSA